MPNYQERDLGRERFAIAMAFILSITGVLAATKPLLDALAANGKPHTGAVTLGPEMMDQPNVPTPRADITPSISEIVKKAEQRQWPTAVMAPQPKNPSTGTSLSTPPLSPAPGR